MISTAAPAAASPAWPIWTYATEQRLDTRVGLQDMLTRPDGSPTQGNTDLIEHALRTRPW